MNPPSLSIILSLSLLLISSHVVAQPSQPNPPVQVSFRPSIAIVIGIFSIVFSLTFLLLVYAKFCHTAASELFSHNPPDHPNGLLLPQQNRFSGIDKTVIESLPFFRFSSLKGSREGLECSVCLSRFEDTEILRLLPKCKHAFHIDCVDRWLEAHSSCPLCRYKVDVEDITVFKYSTSSRSLFRVPSERREDGDHQLFVEREPGDHGSSRFSIGSSFRRIEKSKKEEILIPEGEEDNNGQFLHKFKHRIIVSDVVFQSRWSDVNSSDLMSLNSEMLNMVSSNRFSSKESKTAARDGLESMDERVLKIKEEMEKKRLLESKATQINRDYSDSVSSFPTTSRSLISPGNRCMSEITNMSRFGDGLMGRNTSRVVRDGSNTSSSKDEKVRRVWLPIARRTVQWFAGREKRSLQPQYTRQSPDV